MCDKVNCISGEKLSHCLCLLTLSLVISNSLSRLHFRTLLMINLFACKREELLNNLMTFWLIGIIKLSGITYKVAGADECWGNMPARCIYVDLSFSVI